MKSETSKLDVSSITQKIYPVNGLVPKLQFWENRLSPHGRVHPEGRADLLLADDMCHFVTLFNEEFFSSCRSKKKVWLTSKGGYAHDKNCYS
jgi:hypothetical protein